MHIQEGIWPVGLHYNLHIPAQCRMVIIDEYSVVQKMLRSHSDALRQAALTILKAESLTGQELKDIMAQHPPQDPPHRQVSMCTPHEDFAAYCFWQMGFPCVA